MAKGSGLGQNFYIAGVDLSGDVGSLNGVHGGPALLDLTGINKSAHERYGGERDGAINFSSFFNDTAISGAHAVLKTLPTTDVHVMYAMSTAVGGSAVCGVIKQIDYPAALAQDGMLTFNIPTTGNAFGIEMMGGGGDGMLTAGKRVDAAPTNGASIDFGAVSTLFGMSCYLQVFAFVGTNCQIKVRDSADNITFADVAGGNFTLVTAAPTYERIQTATGQTIRRYVRAETSGTFTSITFAVAFIRHLTATL